MNWKKKRMEKKLKKRPKKEEKLIFGRPLPPDSPEHARRAHEAELVETFKEFRRTYPQYACNINVNLMRQILDGEAIIKYNIIWPKGHEKDLARFEELQKVETQKKKLMREIKALARKLGAR